MERAIILIDAPCKDETVVGKPCRSGNGKPDIRLQAINACLQKFKNINNCAIKFQQ
jgi:hypothetical protein